MYKYSLNSKEKFTCPDCGAGNRFVKFMDNQTGLYLDGDFGKCDRIDSCGYESRPENSFIDESECNVKYRSHNLYDSSVLNENIENYRKYDKPNIFFIGLIKLFGFDKTQQAIDLYKLATFWDGAIIYFYIFNGKLKSAKIMWYDENLHRIKYDKNETDYKIRDNNYRKHIQWLHNVNYHSDNGNFYHGNEVDDFDLCTPLFGWDLLKGNDKTICLVESEKTAVIMSIVYPDFIWLATGGLQNLQPFKFPDYNNRKWLFFPDLGNNKDVTIKDYWIKQVDKISENYSFTVCKFIDFIPPQITNDRLNKCIAQGYDIADFILDYMKYENVKDLTMDVDEVTTKDNLKVEFCKWQHEPTFKVCDYIDYMRDILNKYA